MIIKIDMRERELMEEVNKLIPSIYADIEVKIENLPLGDMILQQGEEELVIMERKSVADLAASIKDGRYEEQSYRLSGLEVPNHNIMYIIEGAISQAETSSSAFKGNFKFKPKAAIINPATIYSAMFSLNFFKGFSVVRTMSLTETAFFLCNSAAKLKKELETNGKQPYFSQTGEKVKEKQEETDYVNVVKKVKKENICKKNIGEIMLCQIPGVSSATAKAVMLEFKSIRNLIDCLKEDPACVAKVSTVLANGQTRKISKTSAKDISLYLLSGEEEEEEKEEK